MSNRFLCGALLGVVLLSALPSCAKLKAAITHSDGGASSTDPSDNPLAILNGFEGQIDLMAKGKMGSGEAPITTSLYVKSDKIRADFPENMKGTEAFGGKGYGVYKVAEKKIYIVSDPQKQVLVIDLNRSGEQFKGLGSRPTVPSGPKTPSAPSGPPTKVTKTGKFDTVAGYKCEYWDITSDHKEGTMCIAQQGVSWFSLPITGIPTEHAWVAEIMDGKHFPLRFIGFEKDGVTENGRIEVTKIDKKTVAETQFEWPPTYRVVDFAQMMQGLGALPTGLPQPPPSRRGR